MNQRPTIIRALSDPEKAFTISNEAFPLSVVSVLHLSKKLNIEVIRKALNKLQKRHILLQASIVKINGNLSFVQLNPIIPIELIQIERENSETWKTTANQTLNTTFDKNGPLIKCFYVSGDENDSELIVCFHHAIIDGGASRLILHELLSFMGGISLPESEQQVTMPRLPTTFRGWNLVKRIIPFAARQMKDEWKYRQAGISSKIPPHSQNAIISLQFSQNTSRKLAVKAGRKGISLNSLLAAAMAKAVIKHKHSSTNSGLSRVISFADSRNVMEPALGESELGCSISMLRFSVPFTSDQTIWEFAHKVRSAIFQTSRRGEIILMAKMSKSLIQMALTIKKMRLGTSALSFIGKLNLHQHYGSIELKDVNAFITNNQFGPEISGFGKILFGRIGLDFTYLTAETDDETAQKIVQEIKITLENITKLT